MCPIDTLTNRNRKKKICKMFPEKLKIQNKTDKTDKQNKTDKQDKTDKQYKTDKNLCR